MYDFIYTLIDSQLTQLLPLLAVVVPVIILAIFALRVPDIFLKTELSSKSNSSPDGLKASTALNKPPKEILTYKRTTAAVVFIDLRDFHRITRNKNGEEIAAILNDFFDTVGSAVVQQGGWIDNYLGDGILVIFGRDTNAREGCLKALKAVDHVRRAMKRLNKKLSKKLGGPLLIGVGLHVGPLLIGKFGQKNSLSDRAIGPAVNVAIRLEELTKQKKTQVIMTIDVAREAGLDENPLVSEFVLLRDNNIPVEVLSFSASDTIPSA